MNNEVVMTVARDLTIQDLDIEAVDTEFSPMSDDDLSAALNGKTLVSNTDQVVLNFRKASAGAPLPYVGEVDGKQVYFSKAGVSRDGNIRLSLGTSTINNKGTQGEAQTRGDGESAETFVMNSLNYKEQVALRALAAIIKHEPNPLGYDDAKIKLLVSTAFRIAVEFQNRAILFRKSEEGGGSSDTQVDVDADSLANNTEKLLYNINESLKNGVAIKGEKVASGAAATPIQMKVTEVTEIKKITAMPTTTHVTVDGTPNVSVSNNPSVNVSNMPTEPIKVKVTELPATT